MFKSSKYTKWYYKIVEKRQQNIIISNKEDHHIIPKSLGGSNNIENIVSLSYREHFICHLLLTKMCKTKDHAFKMVWDLHRLTFSNGKQKYHSKEYEMCRILHIKNLKENHPSQKIEWKNKVSKIVTEHWKENKIRREGASKKFKETQQKHKELFLENNRKNSFKGGQASKQKKATRIEYKGIIYLGWKELFDLTKVTESLYKKMYLHGFDPITRIGSSGPIPKNHEYIKLKGESY